MEFRLGDRRISLGKREVALTFAVAAGIAAALGCGSATVPASKAPEATKVPAVVLTERVATDLKIDYNDPFKSFENIQVKSSEQLIKNALTSVDVKMGTFNFPEPKFPWGPIRVNEPTLEHDFPDFDVTIKQTSDGKLDIESIFNYFFVTPKPGGKMLVQYGDFVQDQHREKKSVTVDGDSIALLLLRQGNGMCGVCEGLPKYYKLYGIRFDSEKGWENNMFAYQEFK